MKAHRDCIPCLDRMVDQIARSVGQDPDMRDKVVRLGEALLREGYRPDRCAPWLTSYVLDQIALKTGNPDPYQKIRQKEMAVAEEVFKRIRPRYGDDFRSAVELAVLGNNLDFFRGTAELESTLSKQRGDRLRFYIDHIDRTEKKLKSSKSGSIVFLADNAGEFFFDTPLVERVTAMGIEVVYGVKERPFINDLTWNDLERNGMLSQIPRVLSTGTGALLDLSSLSAAFREQWDACDLIISKGQANYECLTEFPIEKDVFYLLKAKCQPMRAMLRVPLHSYVALLVEPSTR